MTPWPSILWAAGALVLAVTALRVRQVPARAGAAMILGWIAIFAILVAVAQWLSIGAPSPPPVDQRSGPEQLVQRNGPTHPFNRAKLT